MTRWPTGPWWPAKDLLQLRGVSRSTDIRHTQSQAGNHFMAHNDRCSGLWLAKNWIFPGSLYPEANGVHIKVQAEAWCPNSTYILTFSYNCLLRTTTLSTVLVNFLNHHSCRKFDTNAKSQSIGYKLTLLKLTPKKLFLTASCAYLDKARAPRIFFSVLNGIH